MSIKNIIAILSLTICMSGCSFLDFDESEGKTKEEAYSYFDNITRMTSAVYRKIPVDYGVIGGALREAATDNAVYTWDNNAVYQIYANTWSPIRLVDDQWGDFYDVIHDANSFLENYSEENLERFKWDSNYPDNIEKARMYINEVKVLRALYHFELAKRYGDIPLITRTYTLEEINQVKKTPFDKIIEFVVNEIDEIASKLPEDHNEFYGETGRVTKGAALAIKARALLYAASPLFAGTDNPSDKWQAAAKAAYDVIDLNRYSLPNINNDQLYVKDGGNLVLNSPQLIFEVRGNTNNTFEARNLPIGFEGAQGGNTPTQNFVDEFEMVDGTPFDWSNPTHVANMFYDKEGKPTRDSRLYINVICDGMTYMKNKIEPLEGGKHGQPIIGATLTGYYLKKLMNETVSLDPVNPVRKEHHFPAYRYAEVLLNYAEAMNEWKGPDYTDGYCKLSAREALNQVRAAANMKAITDVGAESFRRKVRQERRIELAFEDHRFWDIRRWKEGNLVEKIYGVKKQNNTYQKELIQNRIWDDKMYLYPIPRKETFVNDNLIQNPGW